MDLNQQLEAKDDEIRKLEGNCFISIVDLIENFK